MKATTQNSEKVTDIVRYVIIGLGTLSIVVAITISQLS